MISSALAMSLTTTPIGGIAAEIYAGPDLDSERPYRLFLFFPVEIFEDQKKVFTSANVFSLKI